MGTQGKVPSIIKKLRLVGLNPQMLATDLSRVDDEGNKEQVTCYIHKAVAEAFVSKKLRFRNRLKKIKQVSKYTLKSGKKKEKQYDSVRLSVLPYRMVEHIDGDIYNNHATNLRWIHQWDLYKKQVKLGKRKEVLDLYEHSPTYQKSLKK